MPGDPHIKAGSAVGRAARLSPYGFDLDAPESMPAVEDEIVAVAVSPRFGNAKAESDGFAHKGQFRDFTPALAGKLGFEVLRKRSWYAWFV